MKYKEGKNLKAPVVLYARVSSKEQEKEGFSIPAQLRLLTDYAGQNGFTVIKEFVDVETAKQSGRSGFNEMLSFIKSNKNIRTILVEKTDRLYRNISDWATIDDLKMDIHFVKEGVILNDESKSSEKLVHGFKVLMAKNFVDNLSEETCKGMKEKALQGMWPSNAPLGYLNVICGDGKRIIEPDPETAPLIAKAFEWYATGNYAVKDIAVMMRDNGFKFRKSKANVPQSTVHKILRNRIYTGDFDWDGHMYKGTYKPIISHELWQVAQNIADDRCASRPKKRKHDFAFSGLIRCGHTGTYLVGEIKKGQYVYYRALGAKGIPYVKQEVLEDKFCQVLKGLQFDDDVLEWVVQALKESQTDAHKFQEETLLRLQTEYKRLESRLQAMYIDKLDEKITHAFYEEKSAEWRKEQNAILDKVRQVQGAGQSYMDEGVMLLELAQNAHFLFVKQTPAEKRRLLDFLVSNCIWKDGQLIVQLRQPFDMLAEQNRIVSEKKDVLGQNNAGFEKWLCVFDTLRTQHYQDVIVLASLVPSRLARMLPSARAA